MSEIKVQKLHINLMLPNAVLASVEADELQIPGALGNLAIRPNHAPLITEIGIGELKIKGSSEEKKNDFFVAGGFFKVKENQVDVFLDVAEPFHKINLERAKSARERAERRLAGNKSSSLESSSDSVDITRAQIALSRALFRIKIAESRR